MDTDTPPEEGLLETQTTGEDRVRMVAKQLSEPRTANWIATEAEWSHEPTKRVLRRLVADGVLRQDDSGSHTTYAPDYRRQSIQEAMRIRDSAHSAERVADRLDEMTTQIREWKETFGVDSPNQLRASVADSDLSSEEATRRTDIAREWEHLQHRSRIVSFALREWEFLAPSTEESITG